MKPYGNRRGKAKTLGLGLRKSGRVVGHPRTPRAMSIVNFLVCVEG